MPKQITLRDIAKKAGVSSAAVSLAMRNSPRVSTARRQKIRKIAAELGYRPNPLVSALMTTRKTKSYPNIVNIVWVDGYTEQEFRADRLEELKLKGVKERADELGLQLECFHGWQTNWSFKQLERILKSRGLRGVIFGSARVDVDVVLDWSSFACVKTISYFPSANLHQVRSYPLDNTRKMIVRLTDYGYRRIGLAIPESDTVTADHIVMSPFYHYQSNIPLKERVPVFKPINVSAKGKKNSLYAWYLKYRPDVVIAYAFDFHNELERNRVKVPDDVAWAQLSMAKTDGSVAGTFSHHDEVGRTAVDLLAELLYTNSCGLPRYPKVVSVPCAEWVDGVSVPAKKNV